MDKARRQEYIIKVCCVIAAFVLWLFITSTENPLTTYKVKSIPVQFVNTDTLTQSNLTLVPGQDLTISLNIKGANSSVLLATKAEDFEVVADLSAYALKSGEQNIPIEIRKSPNNINVVNSDSLFIKVNLDQLIQTKLPITVNVTGKPKDGFYASEPKLSQTYATVVGGSKYVNTVKEILIEGDIQGVDSNVSKSYKLKPVDAEGKEIKNIVVSPLQIDVNIPVGKTPVSETKSAEVSVKTTGTLKDGLTLSSIKVIPEQLDVKGSEAALNSLKNLSTETIDLSKIDKSTTISARVLMPEGISSVSGGDVVNVEINIDKFETNIGKVVQKNVSLDIKYINLDEKYEVKLEKNKALIVVSGEGSVIEALDLGKFSAKVDLSNVVEGENTIEVLVTAPDGVNIISGVPDKILVTITKKETEVPATNDNKSK